MSVNRVTHNAVMGEHRLMVKEILSLWDEIGADLGIDPVVHNEMRRKVRYWSIRLSNDWHNFVIGLVDDKYEKFLNTDGEKIAQGEPCR